MPGTTIFGFLPSLYRSFFPPFFHLPVAPERHATCSDCAMAGNPATPEAELQFFSSKTKCCTYHPRIPNYLVGALLSDSGGLLDEGRSRIQAAIAARVGVTPRAIAPGRKYLSLYRMSPSAFGRAESMVCPYLHLEEGTCTVWEHRTALCSSYFCKFNHGHDGWSFWDALKEYLLETERLLELYALDRLGWDADAILQMEGPGSGSLDAWELDETAPPAEQSWGDWVGREQAFYLQAYEVVRNLDRDSFRRLAGVELSLRQKKLQKRYREMLSPTLPAVLVRNPRLVVHSASDGRVLLQSFSPFDPRRVPQELYDLLHRFDGTRPWRAVFDEGLPPGSPPLTEEMVIRLYQHRVLVEGALSTWRP